MESHSHLTDNLYSNNRYTHMGTVEDNPNLNMNIMTHYDLNSPTENKKITHENKIHDLIDNPSTKLPYFLFRDFKHSEEHPKQPKSQL
jgi:hypothetical protein